MFFRLDSSKKFSPFNVKSQNTFKPLLDLQTHYTAYCKFDKDHKPISDYTKIVKIIDAIPDDNEGKKEEEDLISTSLGHVVLFCIQMAKALDISLKYPLSFNSKRSKVYCCLEEADDFVKKSKETENVKKEKLYDMPCFNLYFEDL